EMFVVEYRDGASAVFEDTHGAAEKLVARVKGLALFGARIAAMLGNNEHTIHRQLRAAKRESFFDCRINPHAMAARSFAAQVAVGKLVHVKTGQFNGWAIMPPFP